MLKKTTYVRLLKENVFCPNNASEAYILNSWRHQRLLLVAKQLQDSTFLFEINSEEHWHQKINITVKVIDKFVVCIEVSTPPAHYEVFLNLKIMIQFMFLDRRFLINEVEKIATLLLLSQATNTESDGIKT